MRPAAPDPAVARGPDHAHVRLGRDPTPEAMVADGLCLLPRAQHVRPAHPQHGQSAPLCTDHDPLSHVRPSSKLAPQHLPPRLPSL